MPKVAKPLGALAISKIKDAGYHPVGTVSGLYLQVTPSGAKSWILRVMVAGKRREMGLGSYADIKLQVAHDLARQQRQLLLAGVDPIVSRQQARSRLKAQQAASRTFRQCAEKVLDDMAPGWKNAKHGQQWRNTLQTYVYPHIGDRLVADITLADVRAVLDPIWTAKTETAKRVQSRMAKVLNWAKVHGFRQGPNPAEWKGNLDAILSAPSKVAKVVHHAALPYGKAHDFIKRLRAMAGMGPRALEFAILTAARSGEVRGATWAEIDLEQKVWIVPADRMKAKREHRVPLADDAVQLLRDLPRMSGTDLIFPSSKNTPLSDNTLGAVLERMQEPVTAHGFRSTFRDWAQECTAFGDLAEAALAHQVQNKVEAAYRRGDLFNKRRVMMDEWAKFLNGHAGKGNVVPLHHAA